MRIQQSACLLACVLVGFCLSATLCPGQSNWPGFLGQGGERQRDATQLPLQWAPDSNIRWKVNLKGQGQSSPVIWGDQAYVTSIEGSMKETCIVTAISMADGMVSWTSEFGSAMPVRSNYFQSRSAPTPCVDENYLITLFETGNLVGFDRKTLRQVGPEWLVTRCHAGD